MPADADIVKFYGCELGAQTKYDKKDGTSIVNGAHDTSKLCELLEVPFLSWNPLTIICVWELAWLSAYSLNPTADYSLHINRQHPV